MTEENPLIGYDHQRKQQLETVLYYMFTSRIITAAADYKYKLNIFCFVLQMRLLQVIKRTISTASFLGLSAALIVVYILYINVDIQISNLVSLLCCLKYFNLSFELF
jgi:hypothetical protein